jgi:hypothetical protein
MAADARFQRDVTRGASGCGKLTPTRALLALDWRRLPPSETEPSAGHRSSLRHRTFESQRSAPRPRVDAYAADAGGWRRCVTRGGASRSYTWTGIRLSACVDKDGGKGPVNVETCSARFGNSGYRPLQGTAGKAAACAGRSPRQLPSHLREPKAHRPAVAHPSRPASRRTNRHGSACKARAHSRPELIAYPQRSRATAVD